MVTYIKNESTHTRRKGWSRSRRGCRTCRIRHIRCDETYPACNRCTSTGRTCEGVEATIPKDSWEIITPVTTHTSVTRKSDSWKLITPIGTPESLPCSKLPDDKANASFHYFQSRTISYLSRLLGSEWEDVIMRASVHSEAIRCAILAVGNAHKNVETGHGLEVAVNPDQWGLNQYSKSIQSLAVGTRGGSDVPVDIVLATCILYICFETLHRNHGVVLKHVKGGLEILNEYRNRFFNGTEPTLVPLKQLTAAFARLETQFCEVTAAKPTVFPALLQVQDTISYYSYCTTFPLPVPQFKAFDNAWAALDQCWHAMKAWLAATQEWDYINASPSKFRLLQQRDWLFADFSMWKLGFDKWKAAKQELTQREVCFTALLECHWHLAIQNLKTNPEPGEMSWDSTHEEFEKVVDLCHTVVETETGVCGYTRSVQIEQRYVPSKGLNGEVDILSLGMGVIPVLFHVLQKCRDARIRLRVIKLLEKHPRLEGLWDGLLVARVGRSIDEVERGIPDLEAAAERGATADEIPASRRVTFVEIHFSDVAREATLSYMTVSNECNEDTPRIHTSLRW